MGCWSMWLYLVLFFLFSFFNSPLLSLSLSLPLSHLCRSQQSSSLLRFKSNLSISIDKTYPFQNITFKTKSWDEGTDCCKGDGVMCDHKEGNVIGLDLSWSGLIGSLQSNSALFSLQNLRWLNLAGNDFDDSEISSEFSKLKKLVSLDLGLNNLLFRNHDFNMLVHNLTKLENMILDLMDLSLVVPFSFLNLTVSMKHLSLFACHLQGKFPTEILQFPYLENIILQFNVDLIGFQKSCQTQLETLKHLKTLNLQGCDFMGSIPSTLGNLTKITFLDISGNMFQGQIPDVFGNLNDLSSMDFSHNNFSGFLPSSTFNLTILTFMDFSSNFLQGTLPNNVRGLSYLRELHLNENLLNGRVPGWLFSLPSLNWLDLNSNKLNGPIDPIQEPNLVQYGDLSENEIQGPIPDSFFDLVNLIDLHISSNNLSGNIKSFELVKLKNLRLLDLPYNSLLSLTSCNNGANSTLPMIIEFHFSSCNMQRFPSFLNASKYLQVLDLSNNQIHGSITKWEAEGWEILITLNLYMNFMTGIEQVPGKHLSALDLRSNSLQGPLPALPQSLLYFLISDNELVGELPPTICNSSSLVVLDLSKNKLGGIVPNCLGNFRRLTVLDLRSNYFRGKIPTTYLRYNLGNNNINDTFPYWLGRLPNLQVLVLRSNRFHGDTQNFNGSFTFSSLRMIDLSRNEFTGHIPPELFENLKSMKDIQVDKSSPKYMGGYYYQDSVIVTMKGSDFKFERILTSFTVIDFSSNHFKGSIPNELGELNSLIVLNFSHNSLAGNIPPSLGKLAALESVESLDLSSNKLQGRIPVQLTDLTFLGALNLSNNNLEGHIPLANHFDTFSNDSFNGNSGLCGFPLSKKCGNDQELESPPSIVADESETSIWKIAAMGYGSGLVLGLSMGYIVFTTGRPRWLVKMIKRNPQMRRRIRRNGRRKN
ncbi:hypothetical protein ES288_A04G071000v1 [Gossypium darwinii]|uniref:Uncharacterized protein n=1 Tax=Gossypium darwinii TaxID=34276 RepID=A0A5D2GVK1_GOSDA|nr:hypothetical protein ES288_A04G071000v1 [Gossypium darwinii]